MINVQNLKKTYGSFTAVDDISFEVKKGEIVGFLGPNGAGKTTTMKILTCFMGATGGSASIAGFDVEKNSFEVRSKVGYLPESAPLYSEMNVIGFLKFIAEIRNIQGDKFNTRLEEVSAVCGLKSVMNRPIAQLSKGYRQRVGLAQAIFHNPDVLILDEPTSGLDPNQIIEIRELIRKLGQEKTVILSTHILPEVEAVCSRVIIINEGRIVGAGTLEQLSANSHETVVAKIRGNEGAIREKLKAMPGVKEVLLRGAANELSTYEIQPDSGQKLNEAVFKVVADNGWSLAELRSEGASLENVFTKLTRSAQ
ncbi:MAG: hypothetical protein A2293_16890 [Elusimicrobia bacterium RIFOXYB2_FULL_49_7]|nr:MAG: hypothetical protein A2293_16890 [Elusimicrobia bacterium RIFOXYB2_FULL_49_7]